MTVKQNQAILEIGDYPTKGAINYFSQKRVDSEFYIHCTDGQNQFEVNLEARNPLTISRLEKNKEYKCTAKYKKHYYQDKKHRFDTFAESNEFTFTIKNWSELPGCNDMQLCVDEGIHGFDYARTFESNCQLDDYKKEYPERVSFVKVLYEGVCETFECLDRKNTVVVCGKTKTGAEKTYTTDCSWQKVMKAGVVFISEGE